MKYRYMQDKQKTLNITTLEQKQKAGKIAALAMDVDGTLTDGRLHISSQGELFKSFDVKDGYAIAQMLPQNGIEPVIITGRRSEIVARRAEELGIRYIYQGIQDKAECLRSFAAAQSITLSQIACIGDDIPDIPMLRISGLAACPADAVEEVRANCQFICRSIGGHGAVREFVTFLIEIINKGLYS